MGLEHGELSRLVDAPLLTIPEKLLVGRSTLITGATRLNGIGFAIAERFAFEGASHIILVGTERSREIAPFAEARLRRYGADVHALTGDVTDEQRCVEMMRRAYEICEGNVDILVNNAGVTRDMPMMKITPRDWHLVMATKTLGAVLMTREWFAIRNKNSIKGGRVIHIGSVVGTHGNFGQDLYAMANAALIALTKTQSISLGSRGITVNLITPGFVEGTDMTLKMPEDSKEAIRAVSAVGELVRTQDIASTALYLAGPDGERVTGATLVVDCGIQSNFLAIRQMHQAGSRKIPRRLLPAFREWLAAQEMQK